MNSYNVEAITSQELDELARCKDLQEGYGMNAEELRADLAESYVAKFPSYITDGPGYSGPLMVIVTGIMDTILITRRDNGTFDIQWPRY